MSSHNSPVLVLELPARWRIWQRASRRVTRITWQQDGQWRLTTASGSTVLACLEVDSWLSPWLMNLRWRLDSGKRRQIVLLRWRHSRIEWHAWQLRLRLEGRNSLPPRSAIELS